ncbi:MAG TPA: EF-P lysine aminoacylase EpmA [Beijerinckiaceae bacterium]|nr:EF-P lysine aminoacylase EpmA [Beijerinckiaceae bacterium]
MPSGASPWWSPLVYADRRPFLKIREHILQAWRADFAAQGFSEVETAVLQVSPGNEAHIGAFATMLEHPGGGQQKLFLHSSPEFACKKLLAAGETRIFTIAKVFRNGERGPLHHPEFTMLEWYRAGEDYGVLIEDCARLLTLAAAAAGGRDLTWRGGRADAFADPERLTVAEAFACYAGIDLLATLDERGSDRDGLAIAAAARGTRVTADDSWSDIFSKLLVEKIEPRLGFGRPTVLDEYPACEAALARRSARDSRLAERFELYACGVELANAFGELTDPAEQRWRFEAEMAERARLYGESYPIDEDFLAALAAMPQASGIALGVDRVVMLAAGAPSLDHVLWTPVVGGNAP